MTENRGAFYIPAEDLTTTDSFTVPGDKTGETPEGTENPAQESYHIDNSQTRHGKEYHVHIKNGWDINIQAGIDGSPFDDREMRKPVREQGPEKIRSGGEAVFESKTGHSYLQVNVQNLTSVPSTGVLEIIIQERFR